MSGSSLKAEVIGSRNICFVCGSLGAEFILHTKSRAKGAYFPFLEHHDPPEGAEKPNNDGTVVSCTVCFSFLEQQWDTFERSKTPHVKRLYWLKRADNGPYTGAEFRLQRDSQMMDYQWSPAEDFEDNHSNTVDNSCLTSNSDRDSNGVLDLSMPDKNANTEVCYICGEEYQRDTLVNVYARPIANCPFFPSLLAYPRPSKSKPIDSSGRVLACDICHRHLLQQWDHYQRRNVPHSERRYQLGRDTVICLTCGSEQRASQTEYIYLRPNNFGEPYFPFLEKLKLPTGTTPTINHGVSQVCRSCYKTLIQQWKTFELSKTSDENRVYQLRNHIWPNSSNVLDRKDNCKSDCYLCSETCVSDLMKVVFIHPSDKNVFSMHFPFIANLQRPPSALPIDEDGCVKVCQNCFSYLCHQWSTYQNENVPMDKRNYSILIKGGINVQRISPHPDSFHVKLTNLDEFNVPNTISTPKNNSELSPAASTIPVTQQSSGPLQIPIGSVAAKISSLRMPWESENLLAQNNLMPKLNSFLDCPPYTCTSLFVSTLCFVCNEYSEVGQTYCLYAYPSKSTDNTPPRPFFPFFSKMEGLGEDGSVLVCQICFHNLMQQWHLYEASSRSDDCKPWQRQYDRTNFICFVCGVTTYRKRLRIIAVKMFPFLLNHSKPPNSIILDNGEAVVVCKICYDTLSSQWQDYERMKVPLELRKYNWMMIAPPSKDDEIEKNSEDVIIINSDSEKSSSKGPAHGSKPPPLTMIPPTGHKPGVRSTATVPPLNQVSSSVSSNSAMNATRTSSFAAALRKLAKQAIDPCDKEQNADSSGSSASISQSSSTSKRPPPPLVINSMQSPSLASPPVVTIAPTQAHNSMIDGRKNMDRGLSTLMEPLHLKTEKNKGASLFSDKRDELLTSSSDAASQPSPHRPIPHLRANHHDEPSIRGFQPYRPGEELRHPLVSHLPPFDPAAYSYHPAFITPSFPHPAFRYDDPYLERYNIMRPPFMHLHSPGLFPHPNIHPMLPGGHYPADVLSQPLSLVSPTTRLSDKKLSLNLDRQKLDDYRQKEREHEQERQEREHEKFREREQERERKRNRERERERVRENDAQIFREHESTRSPIALINNEEALITKYGSITQGTPREQQVKKDHFNRCSDDSKHIEETLRLEEDPWPKKHKHMRRSREEHPTLLQDYHASISKANASMVNCTDIDNYNKDIPKGYPPPPLVAPQLEYEENRHLLYERSAVNGLENSSHSYYDIDHQIKKYSNHSIQDKDRTLTAPGGESHSLESENKFLYSHLDRPFTNFEFHLTQNNLHPSTPKESSNVHTSVISKLDLEEKKFKEGHVLCADESDDEELKEARHRSKLLTITSGPPLKLDKSPKSDKSIAPPTRKMSFLGKLGLITQESKNEMEVIWQAVEENKLRNFKAHIPELTNNVFKIKSVTPLRRSSPNNLKRKHSEVENAHHNKLDHSSTNHHVNDSRIVVLPESHSCKVTQDFVQEFHESVLQTTQQQLKMNKSRNRHFDDSTQRSKISMISLCEARTRHQFQWPGISSIMEAYQRYQTEQKLEKEVLHEQCHRLKEDNHQLSSQAESLSHRMEELLEQKEKLQVERDYQQSAIDNLKRCLKHMR